MKVLRVHNSYRQQGGEDVVFAAEGRLLRSAGQEVVEVLADNHRITGHGGLGTALTAIWSPTYHRRLKEIIATERPDICHFHNTFPLVSPSAYYACRSAGVPVVQTLHNYRLLCAASTLYRDTHTCEDCLGKSIPWPAVAHACYRGSRSASAAVGAMIVAHRAAGTWTRLVDLYVTPSEFARNLFVREGFPADRIVAKPNFVPFDPGVGSHDGGYALFVGRLTPEKGVDILARAWETIGDRLPLVVAGTGALEPQLRRIPGIRLVGQQDSEQVFALMKRARLLVSPSVLYETFGLTVVEAFATGLPVLASRLGTSTELIDDGVNGVHFNAGDADDLVRKVEWALEHVDAVAAMGRAGRVAFEANYSAEAAKAPLLDVYRRAIARRWTS